MRNSPRILLQDLSFLYTLLIPFLFLSFIAVLPDSLDPIPIAPNLTGSLSSRIINSGEPVALIDPPRVPLLWSRTFFIILQFALESKA